MITVQEIRDQKSCLHNVSKDLDGEMTPGGQDPRECKESQCKTLVTEHKLRLVLSTHPCDSRIGRRLDGDLDVPDLTHVFTDGDARLRGIHAGSFTWTSALGVVEGSMAGTTNAGTHRERPFANCQQCHQPGVMEGQLWGTFRQARDPRVADCRVQAAYRIRFDPTETGGAGTIQGTLEGSLVCPCITE